MKNQSNEIVLIGYSGHSLVVAEILNQIGYKIKGYFDKNQMINNPLKIPYLGYEANIDELKKIKRLHVFPSIGDNEIRKRVFNFLKQNKFCMPVAASPKATYSDTSIIGEGTLICHGAYINPFVSIAKGVIINTGAIIEHECVIDDFAHIASGCVLAGNVTVGEGCFVGANSVVKQGVIIGKNSIIGAGTVVLHDVDEGSIWVGNPAKKLRNK